MSICELETIDDLTSMPRMADEERRCWRGMILIEDGSGGSCCIFAQDTQTDGRLSAA